MPFWKKAFSKRTGIHYPQAVRVQFVPERTRTGSGAYTRAPVDTEQLEWIELPATMEDRTPDGGGGDDGDTGENPLG